MSAGRGRGPRPATLTTASAIPSAKPSNVPRIVCVRYWGPSVRSITARKPNDASPRAPSSHSSLRHETRPSARARNGSAT